MRINGTLPLTDPAALDVTIDQAYGGCPQYIHQRLISPHSADILGVPASVRSSEHLEPEDITLIEGADTFMLGTTHPSREVDAS